jgi:hypothetical protein
MANKQTVASPAVTLTQEALKKLLEDTIREHEAKKAQQAKTDMSSEMERLTIIAFKKKGFTDIVPRENVLTYARWVEQGYRVKEGEKSVRVKSVRLFHADQVEKISKEEQQEYLSKRQARIEARTSDKLPKPSPLRDPEPAVPPVKAKSKSKAQVVPIQTQA